MDLRSQKLWARAALLRTFSRNRPLFYLLAAAAWIWRLRLFRTTFIAISGSLGKTTAKECLATILSSRFPTAKSHENRNSGIGVCLAVPSVRPWHRFAVFELSGAAPNNFLRAVQLVRPHMGILLNVLRTHTTTIDTLDAACRVLREAEAPARRGPRLLGLRQESEASSPPPRGGGGEFRRGRPLHRRERRMGSAPRDRGRNERLRCGRGAPSSSRRASSCGNRPSSSAPRAAARGARAPPVAEPYSSIRGQEIATSDEV